MLVAIHAMSTDFQAFVLPSKHVKLESTACCSGTDTPVSSFDLKSVAAQLLCKLEDASSQGRTAADQASDATNQLESTSDQATTASNDNSSANSSPDSGSADSIVRGNNAWQTADESLALHTLVLQHLCQQSHDIASGLHLAVHERAASKQTVLPTSAGSASKPEVREFLAERVPQICCHVSTCAFSNGLLGLGELCLGSAAIISMLASVHQFKVVV